MELLENEKVEKELQPHPISFFHLHSLWIFLFLFSILLYHFSPKISGIKFLGENAILAIWMVGLIAIGIIESLVLIRWRIFIAYIAILAFGTFLLWKFNLWELQKLFIPFYTICISLLILAIVEIYRRSHKYIITNFRLIFRGGILFKKERVLRYEKITDLATHQGIVGKIFGYGTIIPVTQSGFGLGEDASMAAIGTGSKKFRIFGFAGGEKSVDTPRARSYYELHGVYPFKEIKMLIEKHVQEGSITPYLKEQLELQKEMLDLLKDKEEKEEE